MSVPVIGYVVHNKARVALERAFRNPRKRVLGVEWESILTFGFSPQGMGVTGVNQSPESVRLTAVAGLAGPSGGCQDSFPCVGRADRSTSTGPL
jgi:hypothetical protein